MAVTLRDAVCRVSAGMALLALLMGSPSAATLRDLGFADGIVLTGPSASATMYFPMPEQATTVSLVLHVAASPMLDRYSSLTIFADGTPVATIPASDTGQRVTVPIPPALVHGTFLSVRFLADQALHRDNECFNNDVPSVWMRIGADSRLDVASPLNQGIGRYWTTLAGTTSIALPAAPSTADLETATILATALTARGARPVMAAPGQAAAIVVAPAAGTAPLRLAGMPPHLVVANAAAARALVGGAGLFSDVTAAAARAKVLPPREPALPDGISLTEMGIPSLTVSIPAAETVHFMLPFSRLPAGTHPTALQLFASGSFVPPGQTLIATVTVGRQLVWSQIFRGSVALDGARVHIPRRERYNNVPIAIRLVRGGMPNHCGSTSTLSFQLRSTTRVLLAKGYAKLRELPGFAMPFGERAPVHIDAAEMPRAAAMVPLLARLLADAGASPAAVTIATGASRFDMPFIAVAAKADAAYADSAPTRPDLSRVVLARPADGVRVEVDGAQALTVVQTVTTGKGVPGIWVSPGSAASFAHPRPLSSGNVAVLEPGQRPLLFDTLGPLVVVEQQHATQLDSLLVRWRIAIFVTAWIVATLLIVAIVVRLRYPPRKL